MVHTWKVENFKTDKQKKPQNQNQTKPNNQNTHTKQQKKQE